VVQFQARLYLYQRLTSVRERHRAGKLIKRLKFLDGVAFDACAYAMPDDGVQIHKQSGPQHVIDFVFPSRISAHQPLQRGRLVRGKMIDVEIRKLPQTFNHEVHESFKCCFLSSARESPIGGVALRSALVFEGIAKHKFETAFADEWIAFKIEKHVARG